jgi:hypothetical protein
MRGTSEPRPMLWGEALQACEGLAWDAKLAAYTLSHTYLEDGPALLAALEASLWETITALHKGEALPVDLALDIFAWKNAAFMARRRRDDLPPAWDDPTQAEHRRRYRDA